MKEFLLTELAKPMIRRLGTAVAAYLIGIGVQADVVNTITAGLLALSGVGIDLMLSHANRKVMK